jgi:hypothetical protein
MMSAGEKQSSAPLESKAPSIFRDRILMTSLFVGVAVILLDYYFHVTSGFLSDSTFAFTMFLIIIVGVMISAWRGRVMSSARKRLEPGESRTSWSALKNNVKHSETWRLISILTGMVGGVIGFFATSKQDRNIAEQLLILAIPATIVYVALLAMLFFAKPLSIPPPP